MDLFREILNVRHIRHVYGAGWTGKHFVSADDMAPFGPKVTSPAPLAERPLSLGAPKPVRYAPIKKEKGKETFLPVSIELGLAEPGKIQAVRPPSWEGAAVEIEVVNVWDEKNPRVLKLPNGKLKGLACTVHIDKDELQQWLDPKNGPFGARLNENLFDFRFTIPSIQVEGKPFTGVSENRLFFYRRKILVFFPGVFGAQVRVKAPNGDVIGFPDFEDESMPEAKTDQEAMGKLGFMLGRLIGANQKIGVLECDSEGKPLAEPELPKLLMMKPEGLRPIVYDPFNRLREARWALHGPLPKDFKLYRLVLAPYDWRLDLTETAKTKLKELQKLQVGPLGRGAPDSDDEIALVGHSTGGLIIRRILAESGAEDVVSHAFFMNVPFRGAAKPLSVIPTGRDPLDGGSMIPFVDPLSLRAISLTAPIVYHLSASPTFASPILLIRDSNGDESLRGLDAEQRWIELAIRIGFMPPRRVVKASGLSDDARKKLAFGADEWAKYWEERWQRSRSEALDRWAMPGRPRLDEHAEIARRGLAEQDAAREDLSWNPKLAKRAADFHERCEEMAKAGKWADRAYIFYSVADVGTTLAVEAKKVLSQKFDNIALFCEAVGVPVSRLLKEPIPAHVVEGKPVTRTKGELVADETLVERGVYEIEHWEHTGDRLLRERWRLATLRQADGDGTVPLRSLIGFGGKAKVFKKLVSAEDKVTGPDHTGAPNHPWPWHRIVEVLQGHQVSAHLDEDVDPITGVDRDSRLTKLRAEFASS